MSIVDIPIKRPSQSDLDYDKTLYQQDIAVNAQFLMKKFAREVDYKEEVIQQAKKDGYMAGLSYRELMPQAEVAPYDKIPEEIKIFVELHLLDSQQATLYALKFRESFERAFYGHLFPAVTITTEAETCRNQGQRVALTQVCACDKCVNPVGAILRRKGRPVAWLIQNPGDHSYDGLISTLIVGKHADGKTFGIEEKSVTVFSHVHGYNTAMQLLIEAVHENFAVIFPDTGELKPKGEDFNLARSVAHKQHLFAGMYCETCYNKSSGEKKNYDIVYYIELPLDMAQQHGKKLKTYCFCATHGIQAQVLDEYAQFYKDKSGLNESLNGRGIYVRHINSNLPPLTPLNPIPTKDFLLAYAGYEGVNENRWDSRYTFFDESLNEEETTVPFDQDENSDDEEEFDWDSI